ncbi:glycoprotein [Mononegavirales sp.]|nr:glycoprotein [Mononegavirales sp.]
MRLLLLLFVTLTRSLTATDPVLYPIKTGPNWSIVNPFNLKCPLRSKKFDTEYHTKIDEVTILEINSSDNIMISGYLCHKIKYIVTCEENFFGGKTIKRRIELPSITYEECFSAINKFKQTELILTGSPEPVCHYMETTDTAHVEVDVKNHNVLLDPYTMEVVDPIFLSGRDKGKIIHTVHQDVMWLGDYPSKSPSCPSIKSSSGFLFKEKGVEKTSLSSLFLQTHSGKILSFHNSCLSKYCDIEGVRFNDGEWFALADMYNQTHVSIEQLKYCENGSNIFLDKSSDIRLYDQSMISLLAHEKCVEAIAKLIGDKAISQYDVSFLAQSSEGPGPIYWLNRGKFYQAKGKYIWINLDVKEVKNGVIGHDLQGNVIIEDHLSEIKQNNFTFYLPNGFTLIKDKVIVPPGLLLTSTLHSLLLHPQPLIPIFHPVVERLHPEDSEISDWMSVTINNTKNQIFALDTHLPWWLNWRIYVHLVIMLFSSVMITLFSIKFICAVWKYLFQRKKSMEDIENRYENHFELRPIRSGQPNSDFDP